MAEEVDFEALPESAPFSQHLVAGALAGITEHAAMYPLDAIKTRMQVLSSPSDTQQAGSSVGRVTRSVVQKEGFFALWRGVASVVLGAGPSHALYFATYEHVKHRLTSASVLPDTLSNAMAGGCATIASDALMNPFDVVKQRMQIGVARAPCSEISAFSSSTLAQSSSMAESITPSCPTATSCPSTAASDASAIRYRSMWHCFKHTYANEGLRAFYISYPTTLAMTVPFQSIQFATYEHMRSIVHSMPYFAASDSYSAVPHIIAGGAAGAFAAFLTTPLDVCKTLLQTRSASSCANVRSCRSFRDAMRVIYQQHGLFGFWRGAKARVLAHIPGTALSWAVYEYFKRFILEKSESKKLQAYATIE